MSNQVEQRFGINASEALAALSQLDSAYAKHTQSVENLAQAMRSFNSASGTSSQAAKTVGSAFQSGMGQAVQSTDSLSKSLQTLAHITFTQIAIKSLRTLENAFSNAVESAIHFQTSIAEVQTIASGSLGTFGQLSQSVRQLSDNFNVDLGDASKGLYQALSLGFGQQAPEFLASASTLAKAGVASLEDAVNTLGAAINAYGKDASQADLVSSQLVKTVQLGAVRLPDLAYAMGRVTTSAAELGVSLPEVLSAFAGITVRGVKASEAATQIRATFTALEKPTDALTQLFRRNGFASAQAALATLGYGGTLKLIYEAAGGSQERLAQLIPNIRGFAGVLSIAGEGSKRFADNLNQIKNVSSSLASQKAADVLGIDGQKVQANINALKNAITVDLGNAILKGISSVIDLTGGVKNMSSAFEAFAPAVGVAGAAVTAYGSAALFASASTKTLIGSIGKFAALGALAYGLGNVLASKSIEAADKPRSDFDAIANADFEKLKKANSEKRDALDNFDQERIQSALAVVQQLNKSYLEDVQNYISANQALVKNTTKTGEEIVSARHKYTEQLGVEVEKSREIARDSAGRVSDLQLRQSDRTFESRIADRDAPDRIAAKLQRAIAESQQAANQLTQAASRGDKFGIQKAESLFAHAEQEALAAESIAKQTKDKDLQATAAGRLRQLTESQISAEQQLQQIQGSRSDALAKEQARQREITQAIRAQLSIVEKTESLFDDKGREKPQAVQDQDAKRRRAALAELSKLNFGSTDLSIANSLGLTKFVTEHQNQLSKLPVQLQADVEGGLDSLKSKMQKSMADFELKIKAVVDIPSLQKQLGRTIDFKSPDEVAKGLVESGQNASKSRQQADSIREAAFNTDKLKRDIQLALDSASHFPLAGNERRQRSEIESDISTAARSNSISQETMVSILKKVGSFGDSANNHFLPNPASLQSFDQLSKALGLLNDLKSSKEQQQQPVSPLSSPAYRGFGQFNSQIESLTAKRDASQTTTHGATTIDNSVGSINITGITKPEEIAKTVIDRIRREQRRGSASLND